MPDQKLPKIAIVTGATGTVGSSIVETFLKHGIHILAVDRPGTDWAQLRKIAPIGDTSLFVFEADVTKEKDVEAYTSAAYERWGRIDILVNNAGVEGAVSPITDYDTKVFRKVMRVNVEGVFFGIKHVLPTMIAQKSGSIINMASVAGLKGGPGMAAYVASKHAVVGLTRTSAAEAAPHGVRVNAVNPGPIEGRMMNSIASGVGDIDTAKEAFCNAIPAGRYATSEEVSAMVMFLAGDQSTYCNGGTYVVDGGSTAT